MESIHVLDIFLNGIVHKVLSGKYKTSPQEIYQFQKSEIYSKICLKLFKFDAYDTNMKTLIAQVDYNDGEHIHKHKYKPAVFPVNLKPRPPIGTTGLYEFRLKKYDDLLEERLTGLTSDFSRVFYRIYTIDYFGFATDLILRESVDYTPRIQSVRYYPQFHRVANVFKLLYPNEFICFKGYKIDRDCREVEDIERIILLMLKHYRPNDPTLLNMKFIQFSKVLDLNREEIRKLGFYYYIRFIVKGEYIHSRNIKVAQIEDDV